MDNKENNLEQMDSKSSKKSTGDSSNEKMTLDEIIAKNREEKLIDEQESIETENIVENDNSITTESADESTLDGSDTDIESENSGSIAVKDTVENEDDNQDESLSDKSEDEIDNAPTMVMPKNIERSHPNARHPRTTPRKKKRKVKAKKSRLNGSIFGGIIITCVILTVSVVLAVTAIVVAKEYYGIGKEDKDITFRIPEGSDNDKIADMLYEHGIINNKTLFILALKIEKPAAIFPGDITLKPAMGYSRVIEQLATMREKLKTVKITFKEGINLL